MDYPIDTDGAPSVALGGQSWPVPTLAARQNRIIDPLILGLLPLFSEWQADKPAALAKLGTVQYEALLEIAFQAIRRAHPELSRDQFLDLSVTLPELVAAFPVIARQTGVFERASPGEDKAGKGPPNCPTGTPLSPMSAT
jgi:hypothetical protein